MDVDWVSHPGVMQVRVVNPQCQDVISRSFYSPRVPTPDQGPAEGFSYYRINLAGGFGVHGVALNERLNVRGL